MPEEPPPDSFEGSGASNHFTAQEVAEQEQDHRISMRAERLFGLRKEGRAGINYIFSKKNTEVVDPEWVMDEPDEPVQVETGLAHVERVNCKDYSLVMVDPMPFLYIDEETKQKKFDVRMLMESLRGIAEEPGLKIFRVDHLRISQEEFFRHCPDFSEAIDGLAKGYSTVFKDVEGNIVAEVTDHHVDDRLHVPCTCMQVYEQEMNGTTTKYTLADGQPVRNIFVAQIGDLDEVLSLFARVHGKKLREGLGKQRARQLFEHENDVDVHGGVPKKLFLSQFAELNAVNAMADKTINDQGKTKAMAKFDRLRESFRRAERYIRDENDGIYASAEELSYEYTLLRAHSGWGTVYQPVIESAARWQMAKDGREAVFVIKDEKKNGFYQYSVHKLNQNSSFPLKEELYDFLCYIDGLDVRHTASEMAMHKFLEKLDRKTQFAMYRNGCFGGDNVVGGGRSRVSWEVLDAALQWYVELHGDFNDREPLYDKKEGPRLLQFLDLQESGGEPVREMAS